MNVINQLSPHSERLERWLGQEKIEHITQAMRGWYYKPIHLLDVPGSVRIGADGDFYGAFPRGDYYSALDALADEQLAHAYRFREKMKAFRMMAGFASISDALLQASSGRRVQFGGNILKAGGTGVLASTNTLWRVGSQPIGGEVAAALPDGGTPTSLTTGAMQWTNPSAGTMRLTGADMFASVINNSLMLYDRLWHGRPAWGTAAQAVTGTVTRFNSTDTSSESYIGGNFSFVETHTAVSATAHNWTPCTYRNQALGTSTLPSVTGLSAGIADRLDQPASTWFNPLASGDVGIASYINIQNSGSFTAGTSFWCIGHPLGFMTFPVINMMIPFDWLTNRDQAPFIPNSACLALLEVMKPATTATTYNGRIYGTPTSS